MIVPMKVLGLTGGIGMGKSTAAQLFHERGVQVVESDELARRLVEPGQAALAEIESAFGRAILAPDGQLRRDELAQIVFGDSAARKRLEDILHPRIRESWRSQLESWRKENRDRAVVVIPLLFEIDAQRDFDKIICVACSAASQHQRLLPRGWSPGQIKKRIAAQWPIDEKIARADFVIWTEGVLESLAPQIKRIIERA